jgi:hypothetical protein
VIATNTDTPIIVVLLVLLVLPGVICGLKGRWGLFWTGAALFLLLALSASSNGSTTGGEASFARWLGRETPPELPWLIGMARLARPTSFWARRFYSSEKCKRATERFSGGSLLTRGGRPR